MSEHKLDICDDCGSKMEWDEGWTCYKCYTLLLREEADRLKADSARLDKLERVFIEAGTYPSKYAVSQLMDLAYTHADFREAIDKLEEKQP